MRNSAIITTAVDAGVLFTFITGAFSATPARLVGARWFGYPLAWLYRLIIAPQYFPYTINWVNLIVDFIVWFIVALVILLIINAARKRK